jgi:hypothetical protein
MWWLQYDGGFFLSLFMCVMKTEGDCENRAEHRDVENQEHQINKMGLQVNRAQLAVYTGCDRRTRN